MNSENLFVWSVQVELIKNHCKFPQIFSTNIHQNILYKFPLKIPSNSFSKSKSEIHFGKWKNAPLLHSGRSPVTLHFSACLGPARQPLPSLLFLPRGPCPGPSRSGPLATSSLPPAPPRSSYRTHAPPCTRTERHARRAKPLLANAAPIRGEPRQAPPFPFPLPAPLAPPAPLVSASRADVAGLLHPELLSLLVLLLLQAPTHRLADATTPRTVATDGPWFGPGAARRERHHRLAGSAPLAAPVNAADATAPTSRTPTPLHSRRGLLLVQSGRRSPRAPSPRRSASLTARKHHQRRAAKFSILEPSRSNSFHKKHHPTILYPRPPLIPIPQA